MTKQEQVNLRNNLTRRIAAKLAALSPEELAGLGGGTPEQLLREFELVIELVVQLRARRGATMVSPKGVKLKAYLVKGGFGVRIWDGGRRNWEVDETGTLRPQNRRRPLYTTLRGLFVAFQGWKLIVDPSTPPTNHPGLVRPTTNRGERPGAAQSKAKAVVAQPAAPVAPVQPEPEALTDNPFEGLTWDEPGACIPPFIPASELAAAALAPSDLEAMTLKELRTKATELNIAGRSKMNKAALTAAVEEALRP